MKDTFLNMGEFSTIIMPDATPVEHLRKMKNEADEAIADTSDIMEYADCLLALFAAVYKSGFSFEELEKASSVKVEILKKRKWEKMEDGLYRHTKERN